MATSRRPFQPVVATSQVKLNWNLAGIPATNVLHWTTRSGAFGAPLAADIAPSIVTSLSATVRQHFQNNMSLLSIGVLRLDVATRMEETYVTGLPLVGTGAVNFLTNNDALVIKLLTDLRGRSFRGRMYVPGVVGQTGVNVNRYAAADVTALIAWLSSLVTITNTAGTTFGLSVVSRFQNNLYLPSGVPTFVTSLTSDGLVHTQRRRLTA